MALDVLLALEWYDHQLHRGVAQVAARAGWHLTCPSGTPGFQPVPPGWRGDGAITLVGNRWLERLRRRGTPLVDVGLTSSTRVPRTVVDNVAVARLAYRHFRDRGWRRLACLSIPQVRMFDERVTAYRALAAAEHLDCPLWSMAELVKNLTTAAPVAVFAVQDGIGAEALAVARRLGLAVPDQVAVIGVDDVDLICTALPVPLASVDTDQEGLGVAAAQRLDAILTGRPDDGQLIRHAPRRVIARPSAEALGVSHPGLRCAIALAQADPTHTVHALALAAGLSAQGLDLVCQRELGQAPGAILRQLRLRRAGDLLASGSTLGEAATHAGLASASGLCALVRRDLGLTPGQWRQQLRQPR